MIVGDYLFDISLPHIPSRCLLGAGIMLCCVMASSCGACMQSAWRVCTRYQAVRLSSARPPGTCLGRLMQIRMS